jgi:hypothetical protein
MLVLGNHVTVVDHVSGDCLLFVTGAVVEQLLGQMGWKCELRAVL